MEASNTENVDFFSFENIDKLRSCLGIKTL